MAMAILYQSLDILRFGIKHEIQVSKQEMTIILNLMKNPEIIWHEVSRLAMIAEKV